jgi:hypothetical protein
MTTKTYYIENTTELDEVLEQIEEDFPCFVDRELIEMNYSEVSINARDEDISAIEKRLAPLV